MNRPPEPLEIVEPRLLAVEGDDDNLFFQELLQYMGIRGVQAWSVGGKDEFNRRLPLLTKAVGFDRITHLVVVRDKDDDEAFDSVRNILTRKMNLDAPSRNGDVTDGSPRVGIFVLPGTTAPGMMLEDLCLLSVNDSPAMECVRGFASCISNLNPPPANMSKAKTQAFLAAQAVCVKSLGLGAKKRYWDFDSLIMEELKEFLKRSLL